LTSELSLTDQLVLAEMLENTKIYFVNDITKRQRALFG
jgi:hypothetical protein